MAFSEAPLAINVKAIFTGKKAFKQADTATQKLTKNVKGLGLAFGVTFGVARIAQYSKASIKAFAADDKAAKVLSKTLNNLGQSFADPAVKTFISDLERQFGVLDDKLRPAYQKLLTTTGDYVKSQSLLKTALDLSALSGVDVVSVAGDLSKAYAGNTRGLMKYGLGLDKAQLAAMSFDQILTQIATVSSGQAATAAKTFQGQLDKLAVSTANASEIIGGALLGGFKQLAGGGDIDKATSKIDTLSRVTAGFIKLFTGQWDPSGLEMKFKFIPFAKDSASASTGQQSPGDRNKINAAAVAKLDNAKLTSATKLTKLQRDALKIARAKALFDIQAISIEAALKGKISDEDRIRLKLMQAIADENVSKVDKYTKLLDEAQAKTKILTDSLAATAKLANPFEDWTSGLSSAQLLLERLKESGKFSLTNPFADWTSGLNAMQLSLERLRESGRTSLGATLSGGSNTIAQIPHIARGADAGYDASKNPAPVVVIQITEEAAKIVQVVQTAIQELDRAGSRTGYAGMIAV